MKNKKTAARERNWFLVFIASILMIIGVALLALAVTNISIFGWWSLLIGLTGIATAASAVMSIIKNDPSWILLNLILPG